MNNEETQFPTDGYFAAKNPEDVASVALKRSESFFQNIKSNFYIDKLINNWRAYHGVYSSNMSNGHRIQFTGEQGELTQIPVNHFRNLARHMFNMITANRPTMQARAVNTDYKSLSQTNLANGVLDYYMREQRLEDAIKKACEMAIVLGSGFIKLEWNATAGELYDNDPDTGEPTYEGELQFANLSPLDVVVDGTRETWDNDWIVTRTFKNRYNLMAKYPQLADKIKGIPAKSEINSYRLAIFTNDETDDIPVYEFYHKKTEALPNGRYIQFVSSEAVMVDVALPYPEIPVYRIAPADVMGTPYGYTDMFDVFPLQEAMNSLYSTIITNQNAFGVQNIFVKRGADIELSQLSGALNLIEGNERPEPLNLTQTPGEIFKFLEIMVQTSETISGINSVTRGNPEASLRSGNALALVQSMSLQFMSGLQGSYVKLIEDVGTACVKILQLYANTPKVIAIVGKNNRTELKEFTGDKISQISRVVVDVGNALANTTAGRVEMANNLLQMGGIQDPKQYIQIIKTGNVDSITEGTETELLLIKQENEQMMEGRNPLVSPLDSHNQHILEHRYVLADPDLRQDPNLVNCVMDHIEQHLNALKNTDPNLLMLIGEKPIAPPPPPGMPGPGGTTPPEVPQAPQGHQGPPHAPSSHPPAPAHHGRPPMPPQGPVQPGEAINTTQGGHQKLPSLPKVNASSLPAPQLQQQAMGNVRNK